MIGFVIRDAASITYITYIITDRNFLIFIDNQE